MKNSLLQKLTAQGIAGIVVLAFASGHVSAQVVDAYDTASNYTGTGFTGNQGTGFGAWSLSTPGGGDYISGDNPPNFGIWNSTGNSATSASRSFNSSLSVGQSFSVQLMFNNLDTSANIDAIQLEDSSGNVLFSFWQQGGDNNSGWYNDAATTGGTATGFAYDYSHLDSYEFILTSSTTYTFIDLTTDSSIDGTLDGTISQVDFLRENQSSSNPSNGQDFKFNDLEISSVPEPAPLMLTGLGAALLFVLRQRKA